MRDFFSRTTPDGDDQPVDLAQVRADDALIEALRQVPLFDDPIAAPTRWLRSVGGTPADAPSDELPEGGATDSDEDLDGPAAFARSAGPEGALRDPADVAADAQVAALLQAWRNEIDAVPLPPPVDIAIAVAAIRSAPVRRRSVRPMIAVAAAIAGLLMGSTAIGARSAGPEDTLLWPVTQLLWGDRVAEVKASQEARDGIDDASNAIDAGYPDQAEAALEHVTSVITEVHEPSVLATLKSDLGRVQSQLDSSRATSSQPSSPAPSTSVAPTTGPGTLAGTTSSPPTTASPSAVATVPVPPAADSTSAEQPAPVTQDPPTSEAPADPTSDGSSADSTSDSATSSEDTTSTETTTSDSTTGTTDSSTSPGNGVASQGNSVASQGDAPASDEVPPN